MAFDPNYEYDAPKFVDFATAKTGLNDNEHFNDFDVDSWFDNRGGDGGGFEVDSLDEESKKDSLTEVNNSELPPVMDPEKVPEEAEQTVEIIDTRQQEIPPPKEQDRPEDQTNSESEPLKERKTKPPPPNLVTSWKKREKLVLVSAPIEAKPLNSKSFEPPSKKPRDQSRTSPIITRAKHEAAKVPRRSLRMARHRVASNSSTISSLSDCSTSAVHKSTKKSMPKARMALLTFPSTPTVMRRLKTKPTVEAQKLKEEIELEKIAMMQKELKEKRKENEQSMKKAFATAGYKPYRSTEDSVTKAVEFHFATDNRIKANPNQNCPEAKEKDFFETLRQHPQSPAFKNRGPTKPKPFSFDTNQTSARKRKHREHEENSCEEYVSMAQSCYTFQTKTPPRFRTKHAKEENQGPPPSSSDRRSGSKLTCPKTPNLSTNDRKRPLPAECLSREQQEDKMVEEMKNYKFKAREFNSKIFEMQGYGLKPQPPKMVTEPQPFVLTSDQRVEAHRQKEQESQVEEKPVVFKARPVPQYDKLEFKPELPHQVTVQQPFSFEERNRQITVKKEEMIHSILEEEQKAREFRAQPLPSFSPAELPSTSKLATKFEPFNLETENRGAVKADKWIKRVQDELEEERKKIVFKAHSSNVLYKAPFVPNKSLKPKTVFDDFTLNTNRRAEDRLIYDMQLQEKEVEEDAMRTEREAAREAEERIEIANLRKQMVHKHNPIRKYKQVEILASDKPLTQPESPVWHTRSRNIFGI